MNKTAKAISIVTVLLLISKLLGFSREMLIAAYYGATYQTDAYNMAGSVIAISAGLIPGGISTVLIPMYAHKKAQLGKDAADLFANNIIWITSLYYAVFSVFGIAFAPLLVRLFAPNFSLEATELTITITRVMFIFSIVTNITYYITSIARIYDKFAIIHIAGYPYTIFTVVAMIFFARSIGIYALVISYILFSITQALIIFFSVRKAFKFKAILNFRNGDLKEVIIMGLPIYISVGAGEINLVVDRILASGLPEGSVSAMGYAAVLRDLPNGILALSVLYVMYPLLSKYAAEKNIAELKNAAMKAISLLVILLLPVIAVCSYYTLDIVKIVFERGAFSAEDTALTSRIFSIMVLSLIFGAGNSLLNNAFYSMQDTKTPQIAAVIMVACNISLNLILVRHMQAPGLALATAIACLVSFLVLFVFFRRRCGAFGGLALFKNICKCAVAVVPMIPVFLLFEILRGRLPLIVFFGVAALASLVIYALALYILRVELFMEALGRAKAYIAGRRAHS